MPETRTEADENGWRLFRHEIEHSRGFPKLMRGDDKWLANAVCCYEFADEFFERLALKPIDAGGSNGA